MFTDQHGPVSFADGAPQQQLAAMLLGPLEAAA